MTSSAKRDKNLCVVTCALTGVLANRNQCPHLPYTPVEIAEEAKRAYDAGAAVVHIHVRDPATGKASREVQLYRQVVELLRRADVDMVINLTAGMGGDLVLGSVDAPLPIDAAATDLVSRV